MDAFGQTRFAQFINCANNVGLQVSFEIEGSLPR